MYRDKIEIKIISILVSGVSFNDFCKAVKTTPETVGKWMSGKNKPAFSREFLIDKLASRVDRKQKIYIRKEIELRMIINNLNHEKDILEDNLSKLKSMYSALENNKIRASLGIYEEN